MTSDDAEHEDGEYTRYYSRHGSGENETFDTFERAVEASYWGDEGGYTYTKRIEGPDGEVLFDHSDHTGGILEFAEDGGYVEAGGG